MLTPVQKPFKYIYSRFHTLYRMGASQERAAFFNATLPVVTQHPGGPPGRPKIHPALPRFALFFILKFTSPLRTSPMPIRPASPKLFVYKRIF
jgi:hypothetical protein